MTVGERMLRYRAKHRLTQSQLGEKIGETVSTIFRCESGKVKMQKVNEVRLTIKMDELEENENV